MAKKLALHQEKDIVSVLEHYLDYPYPARDPEDERKRLLIVHGEHLGELNHWLFKGKQNFDKKFRVLVAGGGTGDCSTFMGEQLRNKNAEVVYLDFSKNSLEIAKKRAEVRGMNNIRFVHDSIFNIPSLNLGKFDYINCSGVLHHLSSPDEGLKILQQSLKPDGGMCLMVYAKYGRTAVYQIQDIMRMVNKGITNMQEEVVNAKKILASLPQTNWYSRSQDLISDVQNYGDIGIYDLFLHKQDRCYSIPELYDYIDRAGLNFVQFSEVRPRLLIKLENYIKDPELLKTLKERPIREQHAIAEIISGSIIKHTVFLSNSKDTIASFDDMDNVPFFFGIDSAAQSITNYLKSSNLTIGALVNFEVKNGWFPEGITMTIPVRKFTKAIFESFGGGSGSKTIRELINDVKKSFPESSGEEIKQEMKDAFNLFIEGGIMLLRDKKLL
ncbi:MAG: class I SAM-dependent methyltransferase [Rickettsiaceae bacterium]|nr:class I SAM-dependent methyltransferase [Rickettsiaceae bacterium]